MNKLRSYDLETGALVWDSAGVTMNPIPSPVADDGMVFVTSGFRGNSLKAIRLADAKGDITGRAALAWSIDRDTPVRAVAAAARRHHLFPEDELRRAVGVRREDRQAALPGSAARRRAERVLVAGRRRRTIYIVGREGTTAVVKPGASFECCDEHARRPLRRVAGAGGQGDVSAGG